MPLCSSFSEKSFSLSSERSFFFWGEDEVEEKEGEEEFNSDSTKACRERERAISALVHGRIFEGEVEEVDGEDSEVLLDTSEEEEEGDTRPDCWFPLPTSPLRRGETRGPPRAGWGEMVEEEEEGSEAEEGNG